MQMKSTINTYGREVQLFSLFLCVDFLNLDTNSVKDVYVLCRWLSSSTGIYADATDTCTF